MSSDTLAALAADLAWSLWTELGVPGVVRNHADSEIDPEPLIVATPMIAAEDSRLLEQALGWCVAHADRIATTRLQGLLRLLPEDGAPSFQAFAATVNAMVGTNWPAGDVAPWAFTPHTRPIAMPWERPALLRLRTRALCGVGARADVLCGLLTQPDTWVTAETLADSGHTKRNIARVLAELDDAGIARGIREGNKRKFRLASAQFLSRVLGGAPEDAPRWILIFRIVVLALRLTGMEDAPPVVRRIEAHKLREELSPLAEMLWLDPPPITRGEPEAWERVQEWARIMLYQLAQGISPAITGPTTEDMDWRGRGRLEKVDVERKALWVRLPNNGKVLRVKCTDAWLALAELYGSGTEVEVVGLLRRDRQGRPKYVEELLSIREMPVQLLLPFTTSKRA